MLMQYSKFGKVEKIINSVVTQFLRQIYNYF